MWGIKKWLGLALVVGACLAHADEPTYSVDVYPFTFGAGLDTNQQLEMWNRLMKYKLFATGVGSKGVHLKGNVHITDEVGYVGSATGNLKYENMNHSLGGPILFGGSFENGDGQDSILTGPTRFSSYFSPTFNSRDKNYFAGNYCFDGGYNAGHTNDGITKGNGIILSEEDCASYDVVYKVDTDLDVPVLKDTAVYYNPALSAADNATMYIHVPPETEGDSGSYNYFLQSINFGNNNKLYVVMPPNGRLTKIFLNGTINGFGSNGAPVIAVVYAQNGSWDGTKWVGFVDEPLTNSEYGGNLLFYIKGNLSMGAADKTMQGTYIVNGDISFAQSTHFAGQLIAKTIFIDANFDAKDFKYVPFNPPQIAIDMAVNQKISEDEPNVLGYTGTTLDVRLTKTPTTDVTFDYCLEFKGLTSQQASLNDVLLESQGGVDFPQCGISTKKARILKGTLTPAEPIKIWINDDDEIENSEYFKLIITNMAGGTFSNNSREWNVMMFIDDNDSYVPRVPTCKNFTVAGDEDATLIITESTTSDYIQLYDDNSELLNYQLNITGLSSNIGTGSNKANLTYQGTQVTTGTSIPSGYLSAFKFKPALNANGLDYASIDYTLTADGQTTGTCRITFNINPVNDAPNVTGFDKSIPENTAFNTLVGKVNASDVEGDPLTYTIDYGNNGGVFRIDNDGNIYVNGALDYEKTDFYPMLIKVSDGSTYTLVHVNITILNENEPPDVQPLVTSVAEDVPVGTCVGYIHAYDPEDGYDVDFSITSGNTNNAFTISSEENHYGEICTTKPLDYETKSYYDMTVKVTDKNGLSVTTSAKITITDVNESPTAEGFNKTIPENIAVGSVIGNINPKDPDGDVLTFTIISGNGVGSEKAFRVASNGDVIVNEPLNYEHINKYPLLIKVSDNKLDVQVIVNVTISDVNEAPSATGFTRSVAEDVPVGHCIHFIDANDPEQGVALNYAITAGNTNNAFTISSAAGHEGQICTAKPLDYETTKNYDLTVTVTDNGGLKTTAHAIINVTNVNEKPTAKGFEETIAEHSATGTVVGQVIASDVDASTILTYTVVWKEGNFSDLFALNSTNGKITVKGIVDYETLHAQSTQKKDAYTARVKVSDGLLDTVVVVVINVTNINENPIANGFTAQVAENSAVGTYVGWVEASDPEDGINLSYSIVGGNTGNAFSIDNEGNVRVAGSIDYETKTSYSLTVRVTDKGTPGTTKKYTDVIATINVKNVNETPTAEGFNKNIAENTAVGTKVGTVSASDPEEDVLTYKIISGNGLAGEAAFRVDASGNVYVNQALDFEHLDHYPLVIEVSDGKLFKRVGVNISISDINEPPTAKGFTAEVVENSDVDTYVGWIEASDSEDLYDLVYTIVSGNEGGAFKIDHDGNVLVAGNIDYETKKTYKLTVKVSDKGTPSDNPLSVTVEANINVLNGNERPVASDFTGSVPENSVAGTVVGTITGTDPDSDPLTYSFVDERVSEIFEINETTGVITVVSKLNYEKRDNITFEVRVSDGNLYEDVLVTVNVTDVNEAPVAHDAEFIIAENEPANKELGTIEVDDEDTNENYLKNKFSLIEGGEYFTIDENTGLLKTKVEFDYEKQSTYTVKVLVKDQDGNESTANVSVKIRNVKETSKVVITYAETESGMQSWKMPIETIYSNEKGMTIQWTADGVNQPDTVLTGLKEGFNEIVLTYKDPTKDGETSTTIGIFVSTRTPEVAVTTKAEQNTTGNIFTIVETIDENDTSVYVNEKNNDISITIKEPVLDESYSETTCNYTTQTFTVNAKLDTVKVVSSVYEKMEEITKQGPTLNENPTGEVTYSRYNDSLVKVSYQEKVAGSDVTITYITDSDGNVVKKPIVNSKGQVEYIEVITVSYQINVGSQVVNVSYEADAITGQPLKTIPSSNTQKPGSTGSTSGNENEGSQGSTGSKPGSSTSTKPGSTGENGGSTDGKPSSNPSVAVTQSLTEGEVLFNITYDYVTTVGGAATTVQVGYLVDEKGKIQKDADGNVGYDVSYTYVNAMGNSATQSVHIVVDIIPPVVKILSPEDQSTLYSNTVEVKWTVDFGDGRGPIVQDSLNLEGLKAGEVNEIVRYYRDKAGNEAYDVVYVMAKNTKDVAISIEKPITEISQKDVDEYYAGDNQKPEKGQTFSISIYNPQTDKEIETQVGGDFETKVIENEKEVYPGLKGHLGPTLGIETKIPMINSVSGLATLDDLVGVDGMILLDEVDAVGARKVTVDEYVDENCTDEFKSEMNGDFSKMNVYSTEMSAKIWVYTTLGQFVDYFSFTQDLNDPNYASDAGVLKLYFEMKPDENGDLHTDNGRLYATGAYIYKTEITMKTKLRCNLPPLNENDASNRIGAKRKITEDMLKSFGYKRLKEK